jgi:predicted ATP-dependent serine protease
VLDPQTDPQQSFTSPARKTVVPRIAVTGAETSLASPDIGECDSLFLGGQKMAKRLVLFNHKGGVSKTTTVYNVGWMLAEQGHRVLLVDADPQCNLSSLILGDDFDEYYLNDATRLQNIKDGVAPAFTGKPMPIQPVV